MGTRRAERTGVSANIYDDNNQDHTGRTPEAWSQFVADLLSPEGTWDWSRVEVRERYREKGLGKTPGVFAVRSKAEHAELNAPVFRRGDIVGPLGGTVRRRTRYDQLYYA